ncbi:hypothetical protein [Gardnerella vaginalis]|uniref:hypothetical protein n=1 Tax=Gardnerella vaginalis TaxID=2702 RepID=UPI0039EEEA65
MTAEKNQQSLLHECEYLFAWHEYWSWVRLVAPGSNIHVLQALMQVDSLDLVMVWLNLLCYQLGRDLRFFAAKEASLSVARW